MTTVSGEFGAAEQAILKWFDINHLLKILNEMLQTCPHQEVLERKRAFVRTAEEFAVQSELLAAAGHMTYLIDTSISHLSAFGNMVRKVSGHYLSRACSTTRSHR